MNGYLASLGPAVANHLWQSTAFAAAAWLLTRALRGNQARMRYMVWLAASVKFLMPFALLVSLASFYRIPNSR
jgi:bla regulator protein blaR1